MVYDNGNTRCEIHGICESRGQVYEINEQTKTATLVLDAGLGNYSSALGSAQVLQNGNYHFNSGIQGIFPNFFSAADEVLPDGTINNSLRIQSPVYRSFRMRDLYTPSDYLVAVSE